MNLIVSRLNEDRMLSLLRARRRIYWTAKRYQAAVILVTLLLPLVSLVAASFAPVAQAYIAAAALFFGICELAIMDRWQKSQIINAAKLQEEFDCEVLEIRHNEFLVGASVDPEEIHRLSARKMRAKDEQQIRDWYPVVVGNVPQHVARILCQRENVLYDGNVRLVYARCLLAGFLVLSAVLISYALAVGLKIDSVLLSLVVPAMPAVNWTLREYYRQCDTVETLERIKSESEKLWKRAADGLAATEAAERSRELQDAIYGHRISSSLVFEFMYRYRRKGLEARMNAGAAHFVAEFQKRKSAI